jgi:hypothetical protein
MRIQEYKKRPSMAGILPALSTNSQHFARVMFCSLACAKPDAI